MLFNCTYDTACNPEVSDAKAMDLREDWTLRKADQGGGNRASDDGLDKPDDKSHSQTAVSLSAISSPKDKESVYEVLVVSIINRKPTFSVLQWRKEETTPRQRRPAVSPAQNPLSVSATIHSLTLRRSQQL